MFYIPFWAGSTAVLIGWILCRAIINFIKKHFDWRNEAKQLFMLVNLLVLYRITFHPFAKADGAVQPLIFDAANAFPFRVNLLPLVNILQYDSNGDLILNLVGNTAMFIPTGIILPLFYKWQDRFGRVVATGAVISLTIEIIQLPFAVRASDVDDLILNTAGVVIGYGIYALIRAIRPKKKV